MRLQRISTSYLTIPDFFSGIHGFTEGAEEAGAVVPFAVNHWNVATATGEFFYPHIKHLLTKVDRSWEHEAARLLKWNTTGAHFSPSCTAHTGASGKRYAEDFYEFDLFGNPTLGKTRIQSRATMWDVYTMLERNRYEFATVENVLEAVTRWHEFNDWATRISNIEPGYNITIVSLNAAYCHEPVGNTLAVPQSRDRIVIVITKKGNPIPDLDFRPRCYCARCAKDVEGIQTWKPNAKRVLGQPVGKYGAQYFYSCPNCGARTEPYYRPAFTAIDFRRPMTIIGEREALGKKPLKPNTLRRIQHGISKYVEAENAPAFIVEMNGTGMARRISEPLSAVRTSGSHHMLAACLPAGFLQTYYGNGDVYSFTDRYPTVTTHDKIGLVTATAADAGYFVITNHPRETEHYMVGDPHRTITAYEPNPRLVQVKGQESYFGFSYYGRDDTAWSLGEQEPTVTTANRQAMVRVPYENMDAAEGDAEDCYIGYQSYGFGQGRGEAVYSLNAASTAVTAHPNNALARGRKPLDIMQCATRMPDFEELREAQGIKRSINPLQVTVPKYDKSGKQVGERRVTKHEGKMLVGNAMPPRMAAQVVARLIASLE